MNNPLPKIPSVIILLNQVQDYQVQKHHINENKKLLDFYNTALVPATLIQFSYAAIYNFNILAMHLLITAILR